MEKMTIINELSLGRELTEQLKTQLNSHELCNPLIQKILSSYDNALSMLNPQPLSPVSCRKRESPPPEKKESFKKKKTMAEQVMVKSGTEVEDGFNWRKYGQKHILGAKFPRAYYRCTHRHGQGCLATKQVQRSDEDPSIFDTSYKGRHTCILSKVPKMEQEQEHEQEEEQFGCLSFPFSWPENSESDDWYKLSTIPSFNFEMGIDCGFGEKFHGCPIDGVDLDENLSFDSIEIFDFIQNPLGCGS